MLLLSSCQLPHQGFYFHRMNLHPFWGISAFQLIYPLQPNNLRGQQPLSDRYFSTVFRQCLLTQRKTTEKLGDKLFQRFLFSFSRSTQKCFQCNISVCLYNSIINNVYVPPWRNQWKKMIFDIFYFMDFFYKIFSPFSFNIRSCFFVCPLRSFFLFIPFAKHAKKFCRRSLPMPKWGSSAASYHQDAAFRRSWTHWNRYIWTMLYLVSYHSFENPPKKSCV